MKGRADKSAAATGSFAASLAQVQVLKKQGLLEAARELAEALVQRSPRLESLMLLADIEQQLALQIRQAFSEFQRLLRELHNRHNVLVSTLFVIVFCRKLLQ